MKEEIWKTIPGHAGYEVSNRGRVRSLLYGLRILAQHKTWRGYMRVTLGRYGRNKMVHRLVLEAFVGPCPTGYQCDHINTVRDDNRLENLRWVTNRENQLNPITRSRHRLQRRCRPVLCVETGETFVSISEAARRKGVDGPTVQGVCHGAHGRKTAGGLHFRFVEDLK